MGFRVQGPQMNALLEDWRAHSRVLAPKRFAGGGRFSDTDMVRYGEIERIEEAVLDRKSDYSFKEAVLPPSQTLFYFSEGEAREADAPERGAIVFLRSCDAHALRRLDEIYLHNGPEDCYYAQRRARLKLVLIGCAESFENCFCCSMGSNRFEDYDMSIDPQADGSYLLDCRDAVWAERLRGMGCAELDVSPACVEENGVRVRVPEDLSADVAHSGVWEEYSARCIACGRCNFVCPTCSCFTMQDLYYSENGRAGERRRVWASCMVDGFTDVAGGGAYRRKNGERMRFKLLHKVLDYRQRFGYDMCVGCGRCDDVCPEYISFSACINRMEDAMKEVRGQC